MQVILLDKINKLGSLGDQVHVKSGYARNFLFPKQKAVLATKKNIEYFKDRYSEIESKLITNLAIARDRAEKINALGVVTISSKSGSEGKLFGSIGTRDIANAVTLAGVKVFKKEVRLPSNSLRSIGEYKVRFQVHSEVFAELVIRIVSSSFNNE